jgi:hypothetical protein
VQALIAGAASLAAAGMIVAGWPNWIAVLVVFHGIGLGIAVEFHISGKQSQLHRILTRPSSQGRVEYRGDEPAPRMPRGSRQGASMGLRAG